MKMDVRVRADRPSVIDETFDGEAVLVHMGTGRYYALNGAATEVWELIRDGGTPAGLVDLLGQERGRAAQEFVSELLTEQLLVAANGDEPAPAPAPQATANGWADPPRLQRFDDLQDLLLVDPIHDVTLGADGWPVAPEQ